MRIAYIMVNETWYIPFTEQWQFYASLGPGLGLVCIDDAETLEGIAWNVKSGVKRKLNPRLSAKIDLHLFSVSHQWSGNANSTNNPAGINFTIFQFGASAGLSLKL